MPPDLHYIFSMIAKLSKIITSVYVRYFRLWAVYLAVFHINKLLKLSHNGKTALYVKRIGVCSKVASVLKIRLYRILYKLLMSQATLAMSCEMTFEQLFSRASIHKVLFTVPVLEEIKAEGKKLNNS